MPADTDKFDLVRFAKESAAAVKWMRDHPEFEQKPASIMEFIGPGYLNIYDMVRPGLRKVLRSVFGDSVGTERMSKYERAMMTGGIGIGKTTFASIVLPYMAHWVLCLKDPQKYFGLLPGSRIAFMMMSTSEQQAREVVFGDVFARINHSKWFNENYPRDSKMTRQIRFSKDIWIIPGDSSETSFEGYNILGGILDEMDSHKQTKDKDYADVGYDAINSRIASRFMDPIRKGHRGLLICIGQMKKTEGFASRKYEEFLKDPNAYVSRMTIWESLGWDKYIIPSGPDRGKRDSFWYDVKRKEVRPRGVVAIMGHTDGLLEVPVLYQNQFETNPQKALRDLAGIPPTVIDAFITLADRVELASTSWMEQHTDPVTGVQSSSPVSESCLRPTFAEWFRANGDPRKRVMHIDLAIAGDGDALGMAMGHVSEMIIDSSGERKPYIVIDMLLRMKGASGGQILLSDVRNIVYHLRDDLGFRLKQITMDGFNSTDTLQQLRKKKFFADYLSVDKKTLPYEDLRDAIYERRISWPPYFTYIKPGDTDTEHVLNRELLQLQDTGTKIDHPPRGSKDLADAVAGVVTTLMGDRTFHKGVQSRFESEPRDNSDEEYQPTSAFEPAISHGMFVPPKRLENPDFIPMLNSAPGLDPFHIELPGRRR